MKIQVKQGNKYISCDVSFKECETYDCLIPMKWVHRQSDISGNIKQTTDDFFSCHFRNCNGCPENLEVKKGDKK